MPEMVCYIFGSLERNEAAIRNINKNLMQQKRFNSSVVLFSFVVAAHVTITNKMLKKQREQIKKLNDEIGKLKESTESES